MLLMAGDRDYSKIPLVVAPKIHLAIKRQHYELLVVGNQAAGCDIWGEISEETVRDPYWLFAILESIALPSNSLLIAMVHHVAMFEPNNAEILSIS